MVLYRNEEKIKWILYGGNFVAIFIYGVWFGPSLTKFLPFLTKLRSLLCEGVAIFCPFCTRSKHLAIFVYGGQGDCKVVKTKKNVWSGLKNAFFVVWRSRKAIFFIGVLKMSICCMGVSKMTFCSMGVSKMQFRCMGVQNIPHISYPSPILNGIASNSSITPCTSHGGWTNG